jgi:hypothetical protein
LQDTEGVEEIVEIYQNEAAIHVYHRGQSEQWSFDTVDGLDAGLSSRSVGVDIPLSEIYQFVAISGQCSSSVTDLSLRGAKRRGNPPPGERRLLGRGIAASLRSSQ